MVIWKVGVVVIVVVCTARRDVSRVVKRSRRHRHRHRVT